MRKLAKKAGKNAANIDKNLQRYTHFEWKLHFFYLTFAHKSAYLVRSSVHSLRTEDGGVMQEHEDNFGGICQKVSVRAGRAAKILTVFERGKKWKREKFWQLWFWLWC
jgi:hypothetical protein